MPDSDQASGAQTLWVKEHDHEEWLAVANAARERMRDRHNRMIATHGLGSSDLAYQWSMDDASIAWSRKGVEVLRARITSIGSVFAPTQT